jgi:hypothetical protein
MQLMGMGTTVTKVLEFKDRLTGKSPARKPPPKDPQDRAA